MHLRLLRILELKLIILILIKTKKTIIIGFLKIKNYIHGIHIECIIL